MFEIIWSLRSNIENYIKIDFYLMRGYAQCAADSVCMGGTKTQIPLPHSGLEFTKKIHFLGSGGFQNSKTYQANFVQVTPISDFSIGIIQSDTINDCARPAP